jgi:thiamine biosynthesis protein ThiI
MYTDLMISVDELWLKGRNRPLYFRAVMKHLELAIKTYHQFPFYCRNDSQRLSYHSDTPFSDELIKILTFIPGVSIISPVRIIDRTEDLNNDLELCYAAVIEECVFFEKEIRTFRANVKRVDKRVPITSVEIEKEIGKRVLNFYQNARGQLKNAEVMLDIRILPKKISICSKSLKGIGGLPWDTSGHAVTLLSGGFDSPVASFMMSKRGMKQSFVFFYAYPFVGAEVVEKIKKLTTALAKFQRQSHLYIIPFGKIQSLISKNCREEYRTILFRKYMIEAANLVCDRIGADALITGDSLGQVSSQTLKNITVIDKDSNRLILRPLIGFNKLEVLNLAEKIGTHDISILPHDDACALFAPEHPVTNANTNYWNTFNTELNIISELNLAIDSAEVYSVNIKGDLFKKEFFSFDSIR